MPKSQLRSLPSSLLTPPLGSSNVRLHSRPRSRAVPGRFLLPGAGIPSPGRGRRPRAADPSGDPLGRRAGIPELAPECACGRGGEGRGGEFPLFGGRAAAAARSGPHGRPRTLASSGPGPLSPRAPRPVAPPGDPAQSQGRARGTEKRGPAASRHFQVAPPEAQGEEKERDKRTLGRESPHSLAPPAPGPALTRSGGRSRW